ncbi:DUF2800 domain-containing protein [Haploplasma axanthum]|uniref:Protein of uncharacterized function (DUF2800) n=1 Tax=Haploplasma axanthum TaxID=29552 RepID=A0A449BEV4_HAPAX|nr:DUF2800 domain-containing protein [Haploplasma axanthum]VEU80967.1 Protein of uncharacterised function (DUF2800) [Haploplasma axanthum]
MGNSSTTHSKKYSPSKSNIWLNCPLSTLLNDGSGEEISPQAEFGTQCHELSSALINKSLKLIDYENESKPVEELIKELDMYSPEMQEIADGYADFVVNTFEFEKTRSGEKPLIIIEQLLKMDFDEDAKGTLDCGIISSMNGGTLTVIDLKTGRIPVYTFDDETKMFNSQLGIYALYFYKAYKDLYPIKKVRLIVYQPVISNTNEYEMDIDDLLVFEAMVLRPAVIRTKEENPEANPGKHCRYCSANAVCSKRAEVNLEITQEMNKAFNLLTDKEIEEILPKLDEFIKYAEDLKKHVLKKAIDGHKWNGFKLVYGKGSRKIVNEDAVIKICKSLEIDPYVESKVAGITELTKRLGKERFNSLIAPHLEMQTGSLSLVPDEDPRKEAEIIKEGDK